MPSSLARRAITLLLAQSLLCSVAFAQTPSRQEGRPRRAQAEWPQPPSSISPQSALITIPLTVPEPNIRVALTTDARSAVVSTSSRLLKATGAGTTMLALDTSRVRVEPHLLSPLPAVNNDDVYRVIVAGAASREEAEESAKEVKKASGEEVQVSFDTETKAWGLIVGSKRPREEAEELRDRLEAAGMDATVSDLRSDSSASQAPIGQKQNTDSITSRPNASGNNVRLTARTSVPSREVVGSSGTGKLFNSSAPVAFASDDEK